MEMTSLDIHNLSVAEKSVREGEKVVPLEEAIENIAKLFNFLSSLSNRKLKNRLAMRDWHQLEEEEPHCGTSHCLAGWAQIMFEPGLQRFVETKFTFEAYMNAKYSAWDAGMIYIWPVQHLFLKYSMPAEEVMGRLQKVLTDHGYEIVEE